jgi:hypothetical protein
VILPGVATISVTDVLLSLAIINVSANSQRNTAQPYQRKHTNSALKKYNFQETTEIRQTRHDASREPNIWRLVDKSVEVVTVAAQAATQRGRHSMRLVL